MSVFRMDKGRRFPILWVMVAVGLARLFLTSGQLLGTFIDNFYDDELFFRLGANILERGWLGEYDVFTLAKSPFYMMWIAAVNWLGLRLTLSHNLLYLAACFCAVWALRPLFQQGWQQLLIFILLAFNPASFNNTVISRVIRESIYTPLALIAIVLLAGFLLRLLQSEELPGGRRLALLAYGAGAGLALAAFWLTRDEGVWLAPSLALIFVFAGIQAYRSGRPGLKRLLAWTTVYLLAFAVPVAWIMIQNGIGYGLYNRTELDDPDFKRAYGSLTRVISPVWIPDIPVTIDARKQIYKASPAFAELKPYLEPQLGNFKRVPEKMQSNFTDDYPKEVNGGWFMWAFRNAVGLAGYYDQGRYPREFYVRLADEIDRACQSQALNCRPPRATMAPPFRRDYIPMFARSFWLGLKLAVGFDNLDPYPLEVVGTESEKRNLRSITRDPLNENYLIVSGWAVDKHALPTLQAIRADGRPVDLSVEWNDSVDVYHYLLRQGKNWPHSRKARFTLQVNCVANCYLVASGESGSLDIQLRVRSKLIDRDEGNLHVTIDTIKDYRGHFIETPAGLVIEGKLAALAAIGGVYQDLNLTVTLLSLAAYATLTINLFRRKPVMALWIVASAVLGGGLARLALLTVVHITSFPALIVAYMAPVYGFMLLFNGMMIAYGAQTLIHWAVPQLARSGRSEKAINPAS